MQSSFYYKIAMWEKNEYLMAEFRNCEILNTIRPQIIYKFRHFW